MTAAWTMRKRWDVCRSMALLFAMMGACGVFATVAFASAALYSHRTDLISWRVSYIAFYSVWLLTGSLILHGRNARRKTCVLMLASVLSYAAWAILVLAASFQSERPPSDSLALAVLLAVPLILGVAALLISCPTRSENQGFEEAPLDIS